MVNPFSGLCHPPIFSHGRKKPGLHRHRGLGQVPPPAPGPAHRELPLAGPHRRALRDAAGGRSAAGGGLRLRGRRLRRLLGSLRGGEDWQQKLAEFEEDEDLESQVGKVGQRTHKHTRTDRYRYMDI